MVRFKTEIYDDYLPKDHPMVVLFSHVGQALGHNEDYQILCSPTEQLSDVPDVEAVLLLCDAEVFSEWDTIDNCLGCLAVTSGPFYEPDEIAYAPRLMIAINMDQSLATMLEMVANGSDPELVVEACAATVTHEGIHLADLVKIGGGLSPQEIYERDGDWGVHQASTLEDTDWDPHPGAGPQERYDMIEERVEDLTRQLTPAMMPNAAVIAAVVAMLG